MGSLTCRSTSSGQTNIKRSHILEATAILEIIKTLGINPGTERETHDNSITLNLWNAHGQILRVHHQINQGTFYVRDQSRYFQGIASNLKGTPSGRGPLGKRVFG